MRFLLFSLLFFSAFSNATTYQWGNTGQGFWSSPDAACRGIFTIILGASNTLTATNVTVSGTNGSCAPNFTRSDNTTGVYHSISFTRTGDSCQAGATYNTTTGNCDVPVNKCAILANTPIKSWAWHSSTETPKPTVDVNGCEATVSGVSICLNRTNGYFSCTGTATLTGNLTTAASNQGGTDCSTNPTTCHANDPQPTTSNSPCSMIPAGSGFTCTAEQTADNPGTTQCGTANGAWVCVENPKSTSSDTKAVSNETVVNNADGSTTTTTNTTTTYNSCTGIGNCSTTTSTSVSTGGTNANGSTKTPTTSCSGAKCTASGTPGTGTGNSDNTDPPSIPSVSTLTPPTHGTLDGEADNWDQKIDQAKQDFQDGVNKMKDLFKPVGDINLSAGGGALYCPPAVTVLGKSIDFCLDKYADTLSWIGTAVYLVCAVIALLIVFA